MGADAPEWLDGCEDFSPEGSIALSDQILALGWESPLGVVAIGDHGDHSMMVLSGLSSNLRVADMQFDKVSAPRILSSVGFENWIGLEWLGEGAVDERGSMTDAVAAPPRDWEAAFSVWIDEGPEEGPPVADVHHPVLGPGRVVDRCHDALLAEFEDGVYRRIRQVELEER